MSAIWAFIVRVQFWHITLTEPTKYNLQLTFETTVFVLTLIKLVEHRASHQIQDPLMKSLHYGQIIYNVVSLQLMHQTKTAETNSIASSCHDRSQLVQFPFPMNVGQP